MCLPVCLAHLAEVSSRRHFMKTAGLATATAVTGATGAAVVESAPTTLRFARVVDLTHTLTPDFPTWSGRQQLAVETLATLATDGWNVRQWTVQEHTGTDLDTPFHKSERDTADRIPAAQLIGTFPASTPRRRSSW